MVDTLQFLTLFGIKLSFYDENPKMSFYEATPLEQG